MGLQGGRDPEVSERENKGRNAPHKQLQLLYHLFLLFPSCPCPPILALPPLAPLSFSPLYPRLQEARLALLMGLLRQREEVQQEATVDRLDLKYSQHQRDKESKLSKIRNDYIICKTMGVSQYAFYRAPHSHDPSAFSDDFLLNTFLWG